MGAELLVEFGFQCFSLEQRTEAGEEVAEHDVLSKLDAKRRRKAWTAAIGGASLVLRQEE
jgi:hypothetical protein